MGSTLSHARKGTSGRPHPASLSEPLQPAQLPLSCCLTSSVDVVVGNALASDGPARFSLARPSACTPPARRRRLIVRAWMGADGRNPVSYTSSMISLILLPLACSAPDAIEHAPEPGEENRVLHGPSPGGPPEEELQDPQRLVPAPAGDESVQQAIGNVVKRSSGEVQACVDQALAKASDVNGRVGIGWEIQGGKVTDAHVVENSTGDRQLEACMLSVVRSLKFDASITAEIAEFPWVIGR